MSIDHSETRDISQSGTPTLQDEEILTSGNGGQGIFSSPDSFPLPEAGYHSIGVVYTDLTVMGAGGSQKTVESLDVALLRAWDIVSFVKRLLNIKTGPRRPLISGFYGIVPPGETMLVLGRPGSGCSTLLRALTNERAPFVSIDGKVQYSSIDADETYRLYRGEIVFNNEEDIHIPILTVEQTLGTALSLKKPHKLDRPTKTKVFAANMSSRLLNAFSMPHTKHTLVGNEYVRGVSGGERKRVSLAEVLSTNAAVVAWDNCTRGLDSAIALHFLRILKELSRSTGSSHIASIYQASDEMYNTCFDRVTVIYEGLMVFCGPAKDAEQYFLQMGWEKKSSQTTPDFLTSCTSPTERVIRKDHDGPVPQTAKEMAEYFRNSVHFKELQREIEDYKVYHSTAPNAASFRDAVAMSKAPGTGKSNPYKVNFLTQVWTLVKRQAQMTRADLRSLAVRVLSNSLNATFVGAIFYKPADDASGSFATAGAIFFSILYFCIFSLGEIPATVNARALLIKHRRLGMYNPAAQTVAQIVIDTPLYALQTLVFSTIFYFLIGLNADARYFFTFWFIVFTAYMAFSSMYRMIGSWVPNLSIGVRFASFALAAVLTPAGFLLPTAEQHGWASWMRRYSPAAYALEAVLANEFRTRTLTCSDLDLAPNGPTYTDGAYQTCTITGSEIGQHSVSGSTYLEETYGYLAGNIWRNIGILWAMIVIYVIFIVIGSSLLIKDGATSSALVFKRGSRFRVHKESHDNEKSTQDQKEDAKLPVEIDHSRIFTFKDVHYTVKVGGEDKVLLDGVSGMIKPGCLTALMGASGAGKTTLLDTISQRKTTGVVEGEFLFAGRPLDSAFSRQTGFAQQGDVHESYATVRECLQFSALLRQEASVPREEKLRYVEHIIDLLELNNIADVIVGNPDVGGLGVEQRKRLTIAVELAARPESLLFLDEPTSGLDSQAAFEIMRFLRKIADNGIGVCAVIHQPSGDLFEMFDEIILLARGGKTVYAGPTGDRAAIVLDYFASRGAPCPPGLNNGAEHLIATVNPVGGSTIDWNAFWRESKEASELTQTIQRINANKVDIVDSNALAPPRFATSYLVQVTELLKRAFRGQWRYGTLYNTKIFTGVLFGLYIGFYFYKLEHDIAGIQSLSLAILVLAQACPPLAMETAFYYQNTMNLYLARERNGIYSWTALVTALLIVEAPIYLLVFTLEFLCSFWTLGLNSSPGVGGLSFLCWLAFGLFTGTFGTCLGAASLNPDMVAYILALVWNCCNGLSGALMPHTIMGQPFYSFFYWFDPLRYIYGAMMSSTISPLEVTCTDVELIRFNTPGGLTCGEYAQAFLETATGYLANPNDTSNCGYCQMSSGADYIAELGYSYDQRWRDWGIFLLFIVSNVLLAFGLTWLFRIRPLYKK